MNEPYPDIIGSLPEIDIAVPGVQGKLLQAENHQVVFLEIEAGCRVPLHAHGAQWGFVVEGEMDLTIGGETRTLRQGDSYYIPAGVEHGAHFKTHFRAMDFFAEPARYRAKTEG